MSVLKVKRSFEGRLVSIELNLPEKRNVLSLEMIQELTECFEQFQEDLKIQVLILSGVGVHFSAGGDLNWMLLKEETSDTENIHQIRNLFQLLRRMEACPFPILGHIKGSAFGGALGLISLCDIVLADSQTQFCFSEVKLALAPALIAPFVLKKIPLSKARELMLSGRVFNSQEALEMNLIHFVGENGGRKTYLDQLVRQLLSYDKQALCHIKKFLTNLPSLEGERIQDYCLQTLAERRKSPEAIQRIQNFLNRKK